MPWPHECRLHCCSFRPWDALLPPPQTLAQVDKMNKTAPVTSTQQCFWGSVGRGGGQNPDEQGRQRGPEALAECPRDLTGKTFPNSLSESVGSHRETSRPSLAFRERTGVGAPGQAVAADPFQMLDSLWDAARAAQAAAAPVTRVPLEGGERGPKSGFPGGARLVLPQVRVLSSPMVTAPPPQLASLFKRRKKKLLSILI